MGALANPEQLNPEGSISAQLPKRKLLEGLRALSRQGLTLKLKLALSFWQNSLLSLPSVGVTGVNQRARLAPLARNCRDGPC